MMLGQEGIGEQAISKAAEVGLTSQLDEVEEMEVHVKTDPLKAVQGEVEAVSIDGKGLVMEQDLRVDQLQVRTGELAINPLAVAFGKVELKRSANAAADVVLTEQDLNRAFGSDYIHQKLQGIQIHVNGQPTTVDAQQIQLQLPGEQRIALCGEVKLHDTQEHQPIALTALPQMSPDQQSIVLEDVQYSQGDELPELTQALLEKVTELLDPRNFELKGMSLRLKGFTVNQGSIALKAEAHIEELPT